MASTRHLEGSFSANGGVTWGIADMVSLLQAQPAIATTTEPRALCALILKAQEALPSHRRRTRDSISHMIRKLDRLQTLITAAKKEASVPKTPPAPKPPRAQRTIQRIRLRLGDWIKLAHDDEVKPFLDSKAVFKYADLRDVLMRAQVRQLEPERQRSARAWTVALAPSKGPHSALVLLRDAMRYPPIHQQPVLPPAPVEEPVQEEPEVPVAESPSTLTAAVQTFTATMTAAFGELLKAHATDITHQLDACFAQQSERIGRMITQDLQTTMHGFVHGLLEQELGPVAAPPAPSPATPIDLESKKRLPIDVVGFTGAPIQEIRNAFNGEVDLRFISPEHAKSAGQQFRSNVIGVVKFISHSAEERMRKQATNYIAVDGAAATVIKAIRRLQQQVIHH